MYSRALLAGSFQNLTNILERDPFADIGSENTNNQNVNVNSNNSKGGSSKHAMPLSSDNAHNRRAANNNNKNGAKRKNQQRMRVSNDLNESLENPNMYTKFDKASSSSTIGPKAADHRRTTSVYGANYADFLSQYRAKAEGKLLHVMYMYITFYV